MAFKYGEQPSTEIQIRDIDKIVQVMSFFYVFDRALDITDMPGSLAKWQIYLFAMGCHSYIQTYNIELFYVMLGIASPFNGGRLSVHFSDQ